jgi:hypothetical protein
MDGEPKAALGNATKMSKAAASIVYLLDLAADFALGDGHHCPA